jgi:hypothetical protein
MSWRVLRPPPLVSVGKSWRDLWRSGSFTQSRLVGDGAFSRRARKRNLGLGSGQGTLEALDLRGVLQPIAFVDGMNPSNFVNLAPFEPSMTFREEEPARQWSVYAWTPFSRPRTSAFYSPWQLLYVDDVISGASAELSLDTLLAPAEQRDLAVGRVTEILQAQQAAWEALDAAWRPLMKLLVRLQNRYLPQVTGRTTLVYDADQQRSVDPWPAERERFDPHGVVADLEVSTEQVAEMYTFLIERGLDRAPRDGLDLLRRAQPRSSREGWRGSPLCAHDHFQAAQLLRLFLTDLIGTSSERPRLWPLDGRQRERAVLYDQGPAGRTSRKQLKAELVEAGLYPHAVHVVGEGKSEKEMMHVLVAGLVGDRWASELGFTDLGGSGSASRLNTMVGGFTTYAQRTVVIVDSEGEMKEYVTGMIRAHELPEDDVLLFDTNLEESNFTPSELLGVLKDRAANPMDPHPAVQLSLSLEDVEVAHQRRLLRSGGDRGLAKTLLELAVDPAYGGPFRISKSDFAKALATRMVEEFYVAYGDDQAVESLCQKRPLLRFVLNRVVPVMESRRA